MSPNVLLYKKILPPCQPQLVSHFGPCVYIYIHCFGCLPLRLRCRIFAQDISRFANKSLTTGGSRACSDAEVLLSASGHPSHRQQLRQDQYVVHLCKEFTSRAPAATASNKQHQLLPPCAQRVSSEVSCTWKLTMMPKRDVMFWRPVWLQNGWQLYNRNGHIQQPLWAHRRPLTSNCQQPCMSCNSGKTSQPAANRYVHTQKVPALQQHRLQLKNSATVVEAAEASIPSHRRRLALHYNAVRKCPSSLKMPIYENHEVVACTDRSRNPGLRKPRNISFTTEWVEKCLVVDRATFSR